jgi:hypothetical protein
MGEINVSLADATQQLNSLLDTSHETEVLPS